MSGLTIIGGVQLSSGGHSHRQVSWFCTIPISSQKRSGHTQVQLSSNMNGTTQLSEFGHSQSQVSLFSTIGGVQSVGVMISGLHSHMQVFLSKICLEVHVSATDRSRQSQRQVDSLNICPCAQLSDSRHSQRLITGLNCSKGPQVGVMIRSRHSQSRLLNSSSISQESLASSGHSHIHVSMLNLFRRSHGSWLAHPHAHIARRKVCGGVHVGSGGKHSH